MHWTIVQSSAIITQSTMTWFCIWYVSDWGKICTRAYIHKRHLYLPASYGVSSVRIWVKIDRVITALHCVTALKIDTPQLGHEGELSGVLCELKVWSMCSLSLCFSYCNIMLYNWVIIGLHCNYYEKISFFTPSYVNLNISLNPCYADNIIFHAN